MTPITPRITLLASGSNSHGQLANGNLDDSHVFTPCSFYGCRPERIPVNSRILNLASGANHVMVLLEQQHNPNHTELWGCGDGSRGQLGPSYLSDVNESGGSTSIFRRIRLPLDRYVVEGYAVSLIAASWETSYIVLSCQGKPDVLLSFGADDYGDLGVGGLTNSQGVHVVKFDHLLMNGRPLDTRCIHLQFVAMGPHTVIVRISTTSKNDSQNFTVGWGAARHGQLGASLPSNSKPPPFLSTPQIIFPDLEKDPPISVAIGLQHTVCLQSSHRLSSAGSDRKQQIRDLESLKGHVRSVSCTWNGTYADVESEDGERRVFATGSSSKGQLGRSISLSPSSVPSSGLPLAPVQFPFTSTTHRLTKLACGSEHVICIFDVLRSPSTDVPFTRDFRTEVWGWGWNEHGNLGTGNTDDVYLPTKIWPSSEHGRQVHTGDISIWGGCGTSWIAIGP